MERSDVGRLLFLFIVIVITGVRIGVDLQWTMDLWRPDVASH